MLVKLIMAYLATALVFGILDAIWLRFAAPALYRPALGDILAEKFSVGPAAGFYLLYVAALTWFAVAPGIELNIDGHFHGVPMAVMNGAILGLAAYAAYDLTNQATLRRWSTDVTLLDLVWGTAASGLAAGLACFAISRLGLLDGLAKTAAAAAPGTLG